MEKITYELIKKWVGEVKTTFVSIQSNALYDYFSSEQFNELSPKKEGYIPIFLNGKPNKSKADLLKRLLPQNPITYRKDVRLRFFLKKYLKELELNNIKQFWKYRECGYTDDESEPKPIDNFTTFLKYFWGGRGHKAKWLDLSNTIQKKYKIDKKNSTLVQSIIFKEILNLIDDKKQLNHKELAKYKELYKELWWITNWLDEINLPYKNIKELKLNSENKNNTACGNCGLVFNDKPKTNKVKRFCNNQDCIADRKRKRERKTNKIGGFTIMEDGRIGTYGGNILIDKYGNPIRVCQICGYLIPNNIPLSNETCDSKYCSEVWRKQKSLERVKRWRYKLKK